jgi:hypothetical protein
MRYLEAEGAWLLPSLQSSECEVLVSGEPSQPDATRLVLVQGAVAALGNLRSRAISYLEEFVDRQRFANGSEWFLVGIQSIPPNETTEQFTFHFSLEADTYGLWAVTFQLSSGRYFPVAFARRQH